MERRPVFLGTKKYGAVEDLDLPQFENNDSSQDETQSEINQHLHGLERVNEAYVTPTLTPEEDQPYTSDKPRRASQGDKVFNVRKESEVVVEMINDDELARN